MKWLLSTRLFWLVIGVPDEEPKHRPRLTRPLVVHQNYYREPDITELDTALQEMARITTRGDWAATLSRYFAKGGTMEVREHTLRKVLQDQGFTHNKPPENIL